MTNEPANIGSRSWAVTAGLLLGAVLAALLVGGYAWQNGKSDSKLTEAVSHAETAVYLQEATGEGNLAADLLGEYVLTGEEALIPQIQNHSTTALTSLTSAISGGGSDQLRQIAVAGAGLAEGAGSVIALRQAGDVDSVPRCR
jgi:hypothetical protein